MKKALSLGKPAPCMTCENRKVSEDYNCHSDCAAYLAYRAERTAHYEEGKYRYEICDYVSERKRRINARMHLKKRR
jgi:hypothetical protein